MPLVRLPSRPALVGSTADRLIPCGVRALRLALSLIVGLGLYVTLPAAGDEPFWKWQLPPGFPEPIVPEDNPMSEAKVALGKLLFVERGLAVNGALSCADCHHERNYFVDNVIAPTGALGEELPFNTPTLWNVAYSTSFSWIDKGLGALEQQHLGPLTNTKPVELGTGSQQLLALQAKPAAGDGCSGAC